MYDVLMVNPIRDGLNLVAKEGPIINENDGVLALSTEAGAFAELEGAALPVHPFDVAGTADVLFQALELPREERRERSVELRRRVLARRPGDWLTRQIEAVLTPENGLDRPPPPRICGYTGRKLSFSFK